jgi:hypothetical protein
MPECFWQISSIRRSEGWRDLGAAHMNTRVTMSVTVWNDVISSSASLQCSRFGATEKPRWLRSASFFPFRGGGLQRRCAFARQYPELFSSGFSRN